MNLVDLIDQKFSAISEPVEQFANSNGFELGKCNRGNSGWELTRAHPEGGSIYLLMMYDSQLGLGIGSTWQVPCQEMGMMYSHFRPMQPCVIEPITVINALDRELAALSRVIFGHWTNMSPLPSHDSGREANGH